MLQCNMRHTLHTQLVLEDLLAELQHARKHGELGRLALLAYCDVKGWARRAGKQDVADLALRLFSEDPCTSKAEFLQGIDHLIAALQKHQTPYQHLQGNTRFAASASMPAPLSAMAQG